MAALAGLEPLTPLVETYRQAFFGGTISPPEGLFVLSAAAVIAVLMGLGVFVCARAGVRG